MASIISAGTSSNTALNLSGDTSGNLAFTTQNGANTITVPNVTGTMMVNGPAFSVYYNTSLSVTSGTYTKVPFNTKEFDTASCYDNSTNYRFTPTVAGYYQLNAGVYGTGTIATYIQVALYKNGSKYKNTLAAMQNSTNGTGVVTSVVYLNGSTDYVEVYASVSGTSPSIVGSSGDTSLVYFNGAMVRGA